MTQLVTIRAVTQSGFLSVLRGLSFANFAVKSFCSGRKEKPLTAKDAKKIIEFTNRLDSAAIDWRVGRRLR